MTGSAAPLHLVVVAALAAATCTPADGAPSTTVQVAAGALAEPNDVVVAGGAAAGPNAEPLILGPPVVTAAGVPRAAAVSVGDDGHYYVHGAPGGRVVRVDAATGSVADAGRPSGEAGAPPRAGRPAVDAQGRVYTTDPAAGTVRVLDPADWGGGPRPVLTQLDAPAGVAVDSARGRLLVAERGAGRLRVYELP